MTRQLQFLFSLGVFCGSAAAVPADRIAQQVNPSDTVPVKGHLHPVVQAGVDHGAVDPETPLHDIVLIVKPSPEQQAEIDRLLADQQNPSSPRFHQWLTPEQYGERFGLSANDHAKIAAWLKSASLTLNEVARGKNWVSFSGTAGQVSRAFHTGLHRIDLNGKKHFANTAEPSVPAALEGVVGGFLGLNDFNPESSVKISQPDYTTGTAHYLTPEDFATIYNLNPLYDAGFDGTGQSIAIVGSADLPLDDVRAFRKRYGLPANDPKLVLFGIDPGGISAETNLDVE
jgi:subtilase family serine protease